MCSIASYVAPHSPEINLRFCRMRERRSGLSIFNLLLVIILLAVAVHIFFFTIYRVAHDGMIPTLQNGGTFFAQRTPYGEVSDVKRGDVIVFKHGGAGQESQMVWRVIGIPGDTVAMEGTSVWINGERLEHSTVRETNDAIIFRELNAGSEYQVAYHRHSLHPALPLRVSVTPNSFFVLGDNRHEALDSTYLGLIAFEQIIAKKL
jgi:signal peptidase I